MFDGETGGVCSRQIEGLKAEKEQAPTYSTKFGVCDISLGQTCTRMPQLKLNHHYGETVHHVHEPIPPPLRQYGVNEVLYTWTDTDINVNGINHYCISIAHIHSIF